MELESGHRFRLGELLRYVWGSGLVEMWGINGASQFFRGNYWLVGEIEELEQDEVERLEVDWSGFLYS